MRAAARAALYAGIAAVVVGLSKLHASEVAEPAYDYTDSSRFAWSLVLVAVFVLAAYGAGLPDQPRSIRAAVSTSAGAAAAAAMVVSLVQLAAGDALLPRFVVFGSALLLVPWYMLCVALATGGRSLAEERDRVILVATADEVAALEAELERDPERAALLVARLAPEASVAGVDGPTPLVATARAEAATVVVLDRAAQELPSVVDQVGVLHREGMRVRTLSLFYEQWLGKLPVSELERVSMLFDIGEVHRSRYGRSSRLLDVAVAVPGLISLVLAVPLVLLGNLIANRGPLFYAQDRVGKRGETFRIHKFRTMTPDAEDEGDWTADDDPRITTFGGLLRRTHVDELPQFWNILRGELSLVGPRPEQPRYVEELAAKLPYYDVRHLVRPGLTGWAQVKYHYGADEDDALEKLQYEMYYLRHQGLLLDARIVGRTIRSILGRDGR